MNNGEYLQDKCAVGLHYHRLLNNAYDSTLLEIGKESPHSQSLVSILRYKCHHDIGYI